jgi:HK97 family phage prohead protease
MKKLNKLQRPKNMKTLDCAVEWDASKIQKSGDGAIIIEGYANTVDKDRVGDVVLPTAFEKSLPTYMDNPVMLFQHDWDQIVGSVVDAKITDKGLWVKGKVSNAGDVDNVRTKIREGSLKTFSIGYNELDAVYDETKKVNYVKELELLEISVVTIPANAAAKFSVVGETKDETVEGEKGLFDPGFLAFAAEKIAELDDSEDITAEFLKELYGLYSTDKAEKKYVAGKTKKFTVEELQFHVAALTGAAKLVSSAKERLDGAVDAFAQKPDMTTLPLLRGAMWDMDRNVYEAETHAFAIDQAKFEGLTLDQPKPAEGEESTTEDEGKSHQPNKLKGLSESEAAHLDRTLESAWKMAGGCMKELAAAHNAAAKDSSDANMKALSEAQAAYGRAFAEVNRCMEAIKTAKETAKEDGGEKPAAEDKPEGDKNEKE